MARAPHSPRKTSDPMVVLDVDLRDQVLYLQLVNLGAASVRDVEVSFRRKIIGLGGSTDITALPLWKKLAFMPPGKVIDVPIDRAEVFFANDRGTPLDVTIRYTDADGVRFTAAITHDFSAYRGFPAVVVR